VSAPTGRCSLGRTAAAWTGTPPGGSCAVWRRRAGIDKPISPHSLRHAAITAALDAGCSLRDVQDFARHADPRQTRRYDRARGALDRNPTYIVATYLAGATGARPCVSA
jgi:integrase/recombinase XerD